MPGFTKWLSRALTNQLAQASAHPFSPEDSAETPASSIPPAASSSVATRNNTEPLLSPEDLALVVRIRSEHFQRQHRYDSHHCDGDMDDPPNAAPSIDNTNTEEASAAPDDRRPSQVAAYAALQQLLAPGEGWFHDPLTRENLRPLLTRLAARYLVAEKQTPRRGNSNPKPQFALVFTTINSHLCNGLCCL